MPVMVRIGSLCKFWWCVVALPLLAACGGTFATDSGSGGAPASGGASAAGGASAGAAGVACVYQGKSYAAGERFPASDGCNSCSCEADGSVACTEIGCQNQCAALQDQYAAALKRAKACDPKSHSVHCTVTVAGSLPCGCSTPADATNGDALNELSALADQAKASQCGGACEPCLPPGPATCTPEGVCEEAPIREGIACQVGGVVYPNGSTDILEPMGCARCTCDDGHLSCPKVSCNSSCPTGTLVGTQCVQCGPTDACLVIQTACLPICSDSCGEFNCRDGICVTSFCG